MTVPWSTRPCYRRENEEVGALVDKSTRKGRIIRAYSDWFDVMAGEEVIACQLRGKFRRRGRALTGDWVTFRANADGTGIIETIAERSNELFRPPIANVDQAVMVISLAQPDLDLALLDRSLVLMDHQQLDIVICFNKVDLVEAAMVEHWVCLYQSAGYLALGTSAKTQASIADALSLLAGKISVLAGPSGAGKSSLLNAMEPGLQLKVAAVSAATGRGRHTTRKVELLRLREGALIADTPGFSRLELDFLTKWEVTTHFREMAERRAECRFQDCLHRHEPDCAVKTAVEAGMIAQSRYANYLQLVEECEEWERRKYS